VYVAVARMVRARLLCGALIAGLAISPLPAFEVSPKKGSFLGKQVDPAKLLAADQLLAASKGRGFSDASLNRADLQGIGLPMPATEARLNAMMQRIATAWRGGPDKLWTLRDPGPVRMRIYAASDYGAKAKPDSTVLVPVGLINKAGSDDELYWVLAHEYAHMGLAHFAKDAQDTKTAKDVNDAVAAVLEIGKLAQTKVNNVGGQLQIREGNDPQIRAVTDQVWARSRDLRTGIELIAQALSLPREDEADIAATDLSAAMGLWDAGSTAALVQIKLEDTSRVSRAKALEQDFKTGLMPSTGTVSAAVGMLSSVVQGGNFDTSQLSLEKLSNAYGKDLLANAFPAAMNMAKRSLSRTHRDASDRQEGVTRYYKGQLKQANWAANRSTTELSAIRADPEYQDAVKVVRAIDDALAALTKKDTATAIAALEGATTTRFATSPALANVAGRVYRSAGQLPTAERWYDVASGLAASPFAKSAKPAPKRKGKAPPQKSSITVLPALPEGYYGQSLEGFSEHVDLLIEMKKFPRAMTVIAEAKARSGDDDYFLPQLVRIARDTNNSNQLIAAMNRCLDSPQTKLKDMCKAQFFVDAEGKPVTVSAGESDKVNAIFQRISDDSRGSGATPQ